MANQSVKKHQSKKELHYISVSSQVCTQRACSSSTESLPTCHKALRGGIIQCVIVLPNVYMYKLRYMKQLVLWLWHAIYHSIVYMQSYSYALQLFGD